MRSALGFGLLVTAALVVIEAGTGVPRNALESAVAHWTGVGLSPKASEPPHAVETTTATDAMISSTIFDPIPAIARTIAIADTPPSRFVAAKGTSALADGDQRAGSTVPSAGPATVVVATSSATSAAAEVPDLVVPLAPGVAANQVASPTRGGQNQNTARSTTANISADKPSSRKKAKVVNAGRGTSKAETPSRSKPRATTVSRTVIQQNRNPRTLVTVRRGTQASVVAVPRSTLKVVTR
ncbi:MAG: hypothetical protein SH859_16620 [Hyphomicrobium aestuarii]|nr:hypothetical protein [Hyphomicrobium aestuarii]